jgi:spore coat polysaccharide biosynthesis protein SpsF
MSRAPVIGAIQARMGSTRLPGKVLAPIAGKPLVLWTISAMRAVPSIDELVVATTEEPGDDPLVELLLARGVRVHRGPTHDVLTRIVDAVAPLEPGYVVRQTADNPFVDAGVVEGQVTRALDGGHDYVGIDGWPLGIAAEVARWEALQVASAEASRAAEREHVMPFLYRQPDRFRLAELPAAGAAHSRERYTVDTPADLAFARALAERLNLESPISLDDLRSAVAADPELTTINRHVPQRAWTEAEVP